MGLRYELFGGQKCTTTLVPDERANDLLSYGIVPYIDGCLGSMYIYIGVLYGL